MLIHPRRTQNNIVFIQVHVDLNSTKVKVNIILIIVIRDEHEITGICIWIIKIIPTIIWLQLPHGSLRYTGKWLSQPPPCPLHTTTKTNKLRRLIGVFFKIYFDPPDTTARGMSSRPPETHKGPWPRSKSSSCFFLLPCWCCPFKTHERPQGPFQTDKGVH